MYMFLIFRLQFYNSYIISVYMDVHVNFLTQPFMERWLRIQDTCGVHNLHGLPGIYSAIASVLVAVTATISTYGNAYG